MSKLRTHVRVASIVAAAVATLYIVLACGAPAHQAVAPSNDPSSSSQCGKDSDCKGDRICDHGQCVSPR